MLKDYDVFKKHSVAVTTPPMICHDQAPMNVNHWKYITPPMICHDQEPLNVDYWSEDDFINHPCNWYESLPVAKKFAAWHLRTLLGSHKMHVFTKTLLCHSELNSVELEKYQQKNFVGVYYWSHAIIARDWFRYAKIDAELQKKNICQDFLIYNRAWGNTREYRLKFAELVVHCQLEQHCRMGFNAVDEINYCDHVFKNPKFQIENYNLDQYFFVNTSSSNASADYCNKDYQETAIEVVLETLFDDTRWHLTEKTLRPIACGHPFILLAAPNSLEYLRRYGFRTFDSVINESYDTIQDPLQRMHAVIELMQSIQQCKTKSLIYQQLFEIAKYNQRRFFSDEFQQQIVDEFQQNFATAYQQVMQSCDPIYTETYLNAMVSSGDCNKLDTEQDRPNSIRRRQLLYDFIARIRHESNWRSTLLRVD